VRSMQSAWEKSRNIAHVTKGVERSILGYAGESIVIGRALVCGYNLFFKAWRDSKYDAVLDHGGVLYRVEIKQSRDLKRLSLTSGGRSGAQISREVASREKVISTEDCDFLIGVHSLSGRCWVIPTEAIEILGRKSLTFEALSDFDEAWGIFTKAYPILGENKFKTRLRTKSVKDLRKIALSVGIKGRPASTHTYGKRSSIPIAKTADQYAFAIWSKLAQSGKL